MGFWFVLVVGLPLVLAITALVVSLRTRQQLQQEVKRLEALLIHAQQQHLSQFPASQSLPSNESVVQSGLSTSSSPVENIPDHPVVVEDWLIPQASKQHPEIPTPPQPQPLQQPEALQPASVSRIRPRPMLEPDEHSLSIVTSVWHSFLQWFKGGNAIVRVGVIVLLVGIVLLLRLANDLFTIPIEVRLGAVAVGGVALSLIGLKLRQKRRSYAISLQGAGLAIIYFTLFAAYRLYEILPSGLAFTLLAILAIASAAFALLQNALPLALLAFGGGFLAPLLTSTGSNNLVGLFSYYLLLNIALAWLAHYRTWKVLNVLGAFMTFGVAGYLGWVSYAPDMRWPLEGLLLAHLALYLFIVVRYSQQLVTAQQTLSQDKQAAIAPVDSTLLFGVPLMGFALQAGLLHDIAYALAVSSAILSAIYLALGYRLFYKNKQLQLLTEGVLALGIGFMALVIPLALNAQWTAVGWAVQGTALVWLGQRQERIWSVRFGILLQVLSAFVLAWLHYDRHYIVLPLMLYSSCLFICAALLRPNQTSSLNMTYKAKARFTQPIHGAFQLLTTPSFLMLVWSFVVNQIMLVELAQWLQSHDYYWPILHLQAGFYPLIFGFISMLVGWRWVWPQLTYLLHCLVAGLAVYAGLLWLDYLSLIDNIHMLTVFIVAYALFGYLLMLHQQQYSTRVLQAIFVLGLIIYGSVWWLVVWPSQPEVAGVILPLIILAALLYLKTPMAKINPKRILHDISIPVSIALLCWMMVASLQGSGQLFGWKYIPFLNGLDICLIAAGIVVYGLLSYLPDVTQPYFKKGVQLTLGVAGFMALTGMIIRTLHQWAGTPLWLEGAWYNDLVQTSLTIVWTLCALVLTGLASKYAWREIWLVGIALLVIVVAKLLLMDLSNVATVARIVSFIGAGLIMLLIGYIAPLPPNTKDNGITPRSQNEE